MQIRGKYCRSVGVSACRQIAVRRGPMAATCASDSSSVQESATLPLLAFPKPWIENPS